MDTFLVFANPFQILTRIRVDNRLGDHIADLLNIDFRGDAHLLQLLSLGLILALEDIDIAVRGAIACDIDIKIDCCDVVSCCTCSCGFCVAYLRWSW